MRSILSLLPVMAIVVAAGAGTAIAKNASLDESAPNFTLTDSNGKQHSLSDFKGKWVVLEWVNFQCPFVRKHYGSGNMPGLQKEYTEKGVAWLSICSSSPGSEGYFEGDELKTEIKDHDSHATAYLIDAQGMVGRMYQAKTTPHMYVINPEGVLVYAGGIDNIPSTNKADIAKATNYVKSVLDEGMSGKPITVKASRPYGCSVKYSD